MAEHIITLRDENGGISIQLESQGSRKTVAGLTALSLIELIGKVLPEAVKKAGELGTCSCAKCSASRSGPKPTLH
ncbi:hypothetical protein D3C77_698070 [compost metagenome]